MSECAGPPAGHSKVHETVVKSIIALGRELQMRVTVEGIETAEQAAFLAGANGDQAQGVYFGRPELASEVTGTMLAEFQRGLDRESARPIDPKLRAVG
jgi:EAL domain-containing protein (putative c-di-GMP-specific phosphodiesterase class I)